MRRHKRAISPVIATVLLIAIVIVLALIIFLWAKSFISERLMKKGESADSICTKISLTATYSTDGNVEIKNDGNIPLYDVYVKSTVGGSTTSTPGRTNGIPGGIPSGRQGTISISSGAEKVVVVPVVLGEDSDKNQKQFTCPNEFEAEII